MGAKNDKPTQSPNNNLNQNRPPNLQNNENYPVQSNPKFQSSNNSNFPNNQTLPFPQLPPLPSQQQQQRQQQIPPRYDNVELRVNNQPVNPSNTAQAQFYTNQKLNSDFNEPPFYPYRDLINITENPNRYELPKPKVMPLTPQEIIEYQRVGLIPPHHPSQLTYYEPSVFEHVSPDPQYLNYANCDNCITVTIDEFNIVKDIFERNCGPDRKMSFEEFYKVYGQDLESAQHAFLTVDQNGDGRISFDEFLRGYTILRSITQQAQLNTILNNQQQFAKPPHQQINALQRPIPRPGPPLPFGPLDEYDPLAVPIENLAASLKPYIK